jgi:hypothetical protein
MTVLQAEGGLATLLALAGCPTLGGATGGLKRLDFALGKIVRCADFQDVPD